MDSRKNPNHKPLTGRALGDAACQQRADYLKHRRQIRADIARINAAADRRKQEEQEELAARHAAALAAIEARRQEGQPSREKLIEQGMLGGSPDEARLRVAGLSIDENKPLTPTQQRILEEQDREIVEQMYQDLGGQG